MAPKKITSKNLAGRRDRLSQRVKLLTENLVGKPVSELHAIEDLLIQLAVQAEDLESEIVDFNSNPPDDSEHVDLKKLDELQEIFLTVRTHIRRSESSATPAVPPPTANSVVTGPPTLLKPLELPKCNLANFHQFWAIFANLVDENPSFNDVYKFHYLVNSLNEDVRALIAQFLPISAQNYALAKAALREHFRNPRKEASRHISDMLNCTGLTKPNYAELGKLIQVFRNANTALQQMNIEDLASVLCFQMLYVKVDPASRSAFDNRNGGSEIKKVVGVEQLITFLQNRVNVNELESSVHNPRTTVNPQPVGSGTLNKAIRAQVLLNTEKTDLKCAMCNENHRLQNCCQFLEMTTQLRYDFIKSNKRCFACFGKHPISKCSSKFTCVRCGSRGHNRLLCEKKTPPADAPPAPQLNTGPSNPSVLTTACESSQVILATANLLIADIAGKHVLLRVLIDNAAQTCIITKEAVEMLGLKPKRNTHPTVKGLGGNPVSSYGEVSLKLQVNGKQIGVHARVLQNICDVLPACPIPPEDVEPFKGLPLADPDFNVPAPVSMIVDASVYSRLLSDQKPLVRVGELCAQYTGIGYIITGRSVATTSTADVMLVRDLELSQAVERLWQLDKEPSANTPSKDEIRAETIFRDTTYRLKSGHYVVRLPFRESAVPLVKNKYPAITAFERLESRLKRDPEGEQLYRGYFSDLLISGKLSRVDPSDNADYLLVHHAVKKVSSTTAVRPVFNASAADLNGNSLNDQLLAGPPPQSQIAEVLQRFRTQPVPLMMDIRRMFNSIFVHPEDRKHQRILWRESPSSVIAQYDLNTVTFGLSCSPFLAIRTLQQLARDEGAAYPLATQMLSENIYVDDVIASFKSVAVARKAKAEITELMAKGGFELRKFVSSHPALLEDVPAEHRAEISLDPESTVKVLGLHWVPGTDDFRYRIQPFDNPVTKRNVLRYTARIFDVQGYLAPCTVWLKFFIKRLWIEKCEWDETVPQELANEWRQFTDELPQLTVLKIPRYIPVFACDRVDLIGFSDGSSVGHGYSLYLRCVTADRANLYLIKAKGKANPAKPQLTIPRAELQAATELIKAYGNLDFLKGLSIINTWFCVDSTILLAWLALPPSKLSVFVGNRISFLQSQTDIEQWKFVRSADNAADPVSRALSPPDLLTCGTYWQGPSFLQREPIVWPTLTPANEIPEAKLESTVLLTTQINEGIEELLQRFSSFSRAIRCVAWLTRWTSQPPRSVRQNFLTVPELRESEIRIIREVQKQFDSELLRNCKTLTPFRDDQGILRVGGRLGSAPLPWTRRHPVLIPRQSHLSLLICRDAHLMTLHSGPSRMKAFIQRKFWIPGVTSMLKKYTHDCLICYRLQTAAKQPLMADLPPSRFSTGRPFINTASDYAGPFLVHEGTRPRARMIKVYVCLFTCMATRASHLEVVDSLSAESYLAAVDRFISRRGKPALMFSDNGTNYKAAAKVTEEIAHYLDENSSDFTRLLANRGVTFQFSPPTAPWCNGICESLIGVFKSHLIRLTRSHKLTFCEFQTLVTRIEAVMNSRPLIPLTSDPDDYDLILTPGHFLVFDHMLSMPEMPLADVKETVLSRWQLVRSLLQQFWRLWLRHYVPLLIHRTKWTGDVDNLRVGDVVVVKGEHTPPLSWPLGRIIRVLPNPDGVVRTVVVKTPTGELTRPSRRLVKLLVN